MNEERDLIVGRVVEIGDIEKATGKQPLINTYHETNDLNQPLNF